MPSRATAIKRPRDVREQEESGVLGGLWRSVTNFLFPTSYAASVPDPRAERPTKRARAEQQDQVEAKGEAELSRLTIDELKERGYTAEEVQRIFHSSRAKPKR